MEVLRRLNDKAFGLTLTPSFASAVEDHLCSGLSELALDSILELEDFNVRHA